MKRFIALALSILIPLSMYLIIIANDFRLAIFLIGLVYIAGVVICLVGFPLVARADGSDIIYALAIGIFFTLTIIPAFFVGLFFLIALFGSDKNNVVFI